jgi:hypothetical protein
MAAIVPSASLRVKYTCPEPGKDGREISPLILT